MPRTVGSDAASELRKPHINVFTWIALFNAFRIRRLGPVGRMGVIGREFRLALVPLFEPFYWNLKGFARRGECLSMPVSGHGDLS
jgi:hypothetical protein